MTVKINEVFYANVVLNFPQKLAKMKGFRCNFDMSRITFIHYFIHCLFKSRPEKLHLEFPWMTPSGLTMGISKKVYFFISYWTYSTSMHRSSIILSIKLDPMTSPGCCRAMKTTTFLLVENLAYSITIRPSSRLAGAVNVMIGMILHEIE